MQSLSTQAKGSKIAKAPKVSKVSKASKPFGATGVGAGEVQVADLDSNIQKEFMAKVKDVEREIKARKEAFTKVTVKSVLNEAKRSVHRLALAEEKDLRERVQAATAKAHAKNLVSRGMRPLPNEA